MQRGHAVALRGVDVGTAAQQRPHAFGVAAHRRVGDASVRRRSREARGQDQNAQRNRDRPHSCSSRTAVRR